MKTLKRVYLVVVEWSDKDTPKGSKDGKYVVKDPKTGKKTSNRISRPDLRRRFRFYNPLNFGLTPS